MLTAMGFRNSHFAAILFFLCTVTLSAAASPARPLNIIQASANDNITSSFNRTLPPSLKYAPLYPLLSLQIFDSHHRSHLPPDPVEFRIPSSTQSVRYSHYGRQLPRADVLSCLVQATSDVIRELNNGKDKWIGKAELQKSSNSVYLILHPGNEMTWGMWGTTLRGLADFVERWEFRDLDFDITEFGLIGMVGNGMLVYV